MTRNDGLCCKTHVLDLAASLNSGGGELYRPEIALQTALALGAHKAIDKPFELQPSLAAVEQALAA